MAKIQLLSEILCRLCDEPAECRIVGGYRSISLYSSDCFCLSCGKKKLAGINKWRKASEPDEPELVARLECRRRSFDILNRGDLSPSGREGTPEIRELVISPLCTRALDFFSQLAESGKSEPFTFVGVDIEVDFTAHVACAEKISDGIRVRLSKLHDFETRFTI